MATLERLDELIDGPKRAPSINELRGKRAELIERMRNLHNGAERRNQDLTGKQLVEFRELDEKVEQLTERITEKEKRERSEALEHSTLLRDGDGWADRAATALLNMSESRAVVSGSIDIPQLVRPDVVADPYNPSRITDLLVNRETLRGNSFEYLRQTVRTNNADTVADSALKPTSVFTVESVEDRARVIAHLSEPAPIRIFQDHRNVRQWMDREMREGVLDALETQVVAGDGTGENLTGILTDAGTTTVAFDTDRITSLRKGRTALQLLHEQPTAWVMHPTDAELIDLEREGTDGGFLSQASDLDPVFGPHQRVISTSVTQGTAILADWTQVRLYLREGVRIDVDTGGDLFDKNEVKLRAEMRAGLGILRPQAFAIVALESA